MRIIVEGTAGEGKTAIANVIIGTLAQVGIAAELIDNDGSPDMSAPSVEECEKILNSVLDKHIKSGVPFVIETRQIRKESSA